MIYNMIEFASEALLAGFGLGFFFGNLVSLIKYIITSVFHWIRS